MLILKIAALGPIHGYAIALRVEQISNDVFQLQQGRCIRPCTNWKKTSCYQPSGSRPIPAERRSSIH